MPAITEDDIKSLAAIRSASAPITSCYLDVDGAKHVRPTDYERVFDALARRTLGRNGHSDTVPADLERIGERIRAGFDRSEVRGVAIFASGPEDLFVVHELPVSVRSEIVVNPAPALGQLELIVQQTEKLAVLCADKKHARVFVFRLGELVEHTERTDDLGRDYDTVGEQDRGDVDDHREELAHQHVRHAAELLWSVYQSEGFDHVALAAPAAIQHELEDALHPYLRERLAEPLDLEPSASLAEVRAAAMAAERRIEMAREAALVEELRAAVASNGRGVAGIDDVLDRLHDKRVQRLLVSDGYAVEGWLCEGCGRLATVGRTCACGDEMTHIEDVVEEAVEVALSQSCVVDVCAGNADLDVLGRIGALLRY